jgi:TP901 family phage tail tape measure protein
MADYNLGTAHGVIEIDSNTQGIDQAQRSMQGLQKTSQTTEQALDKTANTTGIAGAAIAGGLGLAVKTATDFEKRMSAISAVSGASAGDLEKLRQKSLQLGAETSFSAGEAAGAIEELVKSGLSVPDVMNGAADATVALAAAGEIELPEAASIASQALNQFKLTAEDLPGVADLLAGAANASATGVSEVGAALSYVGPVAQAAGLSIEDTAASVALLANNGIDGQRAGTALRAILTQLQPATNKARDAMTDLGLVTKDGQNQFYNTNGTLKDMDQIIGLLNESMAGLSEEEKTAYARNMFGLESLSAISAMAGTTAGEFQDLQGAIGEVSAQEVAEERLNNLSGSMDALMGSAETLGIQLGTALIPFIRSLTDALTIVVNWFSSLSPETQQWIVTILAASAGLLLLTAGVIKTILMMRSFMATLRTLRILSTATRAGFLKMALQGIVSLMRLALQGAMWLGRLVIRVTVATAKMVARFVWFAIQSAAQAARVVLSWTLAGARLAAQWAMMALRAGLSAARIGAVWLAQTVATTGRLLLSWGLAVARVIAGWVLMGIQSLIQAARMAAAWLIAMGPVGWVIAAVIALVALIIANWDKIKAWTTKAWNAVWGFIKKAAAWIWNLFLNWTLIGLIIKHWDTIKNTFSKGVSAVINFVKNLPQKIKDFFSGAASWLVNAGKSLLEGLWNGISNAAGWLKDKVLGWAGGLMDGVKDFFGIGSPAKLFEDEVGRWLPAGIAVGIEANAGEALRAASSLVDAVSGSVSMSASGPGTFWDDRGTGSGYVPPSREVASYAASQGDAAASGGQGPTYQFITNNPVAERASDSNARRLRSLSSLGPFGGND